MTLASCVVVGILQGDGNCRLRRAATDLGDRGDDTRLNSRADFKPVKRNGDEPTSCRLPSRAFRTATRSARPLGKVSRGVVGARVSPTAAASQHTAPAQRLQLPWVRGGGGGGGQRAGRFHGPRGLPVTRTTARLSQQVSGASCSGGG
ncbi:unnamed protein product [Lampetra planeri]